MKRLLALFVALVIGTGCVSDEAKREWQEAVKDARGDNMQMHTDLGSSGTRPAPSKSSD